MMKKSTFILTTSFTCFVYLFCLLVFRIINKWLCKLCKKYYNLWKSFYFRCTFFFWRFHWNICRLIANKYQFIIHYHEINSLDYPNIDTTLDDVGCCSGGNIEVLAVATLKQKNYSSWVEIVTKAEKRIFTAIT